MFSAAPPETLVKIFNVFAQGLVFFAFQQRHLKHFDKMQKGVRFPKPSSLPQSLHSPLPVWVWRKETERGESGSGAERPFFGCRLGSAHVLGTTCLADKTNHPVKRAESQ